jgi:hypothetical protein
LLKQSNSITIGLQDSSRNGEEEDAVALAFVEYHIIARKQTKKGGGVQKKMLGSVLDPSAELFGQYETLLHYLVKMKTDTPHFRARLSL